MRTFDVIANGLSPLMEDRFFGQETGTPQEKLYLSSKDGKTLIWPNANVMGFFASKSSVSVIRLGMMGEGRDKNAAVLMGSLAIEPTEIPILSNGKPIVFEGTWTDQLYLDTRMARPSATARVMVTRPVIDVPWSMAFVLRVVETKDVTVENVMTWLENGGLLVGFGAFRPLFGRFLVECTERSAA